MSDDVATTALGTPENSLSIFNGSALVNIPQVSPISNQFFGLVPGGKELPPTFCNNLDDKFTRKFRSRTYYGG